MDEKSLDDLLQARRESLGSSLPPNFQQNVLREIRMRRHSSSGEHEASSLWQWLLRPQFVTALLAMAMFVGIGLGRQQHDHLAAHTKQALNLDVFGAMPPSLPSTLLTSNL